MTSKVIVCDLDGTLAPSKTPLEASMALVLCRVLQKHKLAVISGASYAQFQSQFLDHLSCGGEILQNLYLFPTNGTACYEYDNLSNAWQVYDEKMTKEEINKIILALKNAILKSGVDVSNPYGELIEDRGSQVTFSGRGQQAPLEVKKVWDPDKVKRQKIVEILEKDIPEFEIRINANSSIDITHKGIDKAYAMRKIEELLNVGKENIVFLGDALFPGGNDSSVIPTGVECIAVSGPEDTEKVLLSLL